MKLSSGQKAKGKKPVFNKSIPPITANALTKTALRVLTLNGYHVWRQNNAAVYDPKQKVFRKNSATPGISDILGYCRKTGRIVACEIKVGKDRLSVEQTRFLEGVQASGGLAVVIKTIDDLLRFTNSK